MAPSLPELIRQTRLEYLAREHFPVPSFYEINNGFCEEFACEVIELTRQLGMAGEFMDLCTSSLRIGINGDLDGDDVWDWALLQEHWSTTPPAGLSAEDMDELCFGYHVWIAHEGRHYDAECPDGVDSPFDLPIFRRVVVQALKKQGVPTAEVITDDVPLTLDGKPVAHLTYLGKVVAFLREIGIPVSWKVGADGFLPFLEIEAGGLLIDPRCPASNALHEAAHLAIVPAEYRHLMGRNVAGGLRQMLDRIGELGLPPDHPKVRAALQCSDPEATAWAWAAGLALGIPHEQIILDTEYDGTGADIRACLIARAYVGINGLQHAGFTAAREQYTWLGLPTYPLLAFWLQGGPAPATQLAALAG